MKKPCAAPSPASTTIFNEHGRSFSRSAICSARRGTPAPPGKADFRDMPARTLLGAFLWSARSVSGTRSDEPQCRPGPSSMNWTWATGLPTLASASRSCRASRTRRSLATLPPASGKRRYRHGRASCAGDACAVWGHGLQPGSCRSTAAIRNLWPCTLARTLAALLSTTPTPPRRRRARSLPRGMVRRSS